MQATTLLILAVVAVPLSLAGCIVDDDADESSAQDARQFSVDLPEGATQVHVDVNARATAGEPDATVLIESTSGGNLASDTFGIAGTTQRRVSAEVSAHDRVVVTVRVIDGDAELDVRVSATVPGAQPVVVIEERVVIVHVDQAPAATTPAASPTPPASPPPATPPATSPPTNTTPPANETNSTNATG